jgi:hypothetical protein
MKFIHGTGFISINAPIKGNPINRNQWDIMRFRHGKGFISINTTNRRNKEFQSVGTNGIK